MLKDTFLHRMKGISIDIGDYTLYSKPCRIVNIDTNDEVKFKDMKDAYEHGMVGSVSLKEFVEKADDSIFVATNDDWGIRFENMH